MSETQLNPWRGRIVLLTLVHGVGTIGYTSVMTMAPVIRAELDLNATQVGSFMSAFYLALILGAIPAGVLADYAGARCVHVRVPDRVNNAGTLWGYPVHRQLLGWRVENPSPPTCRSSIKRTRHPLKSPITTVVVL